MNTTVRITALLILSLAVGSALIASLIPTPERTFRVGALLCLSGSCAEWGSNSLKGLTLAAEELNRRGGISGKPVEIVAEDSAEDTPARGVAAFHALLSGHKVRYVVGPTWSAVGNTLGPIAASKSELLMISPSAGLRDFNESGPNLFNLWPHDDVATRALAQHAYAKGLRKGAIASSQQPWEKSQGDTFEAEFIRLGGQIVAKEEPLPSAVDLQTEALRIIRAKPEFVLFSNFQQMGIFARDLSELGYCGERIAVLMDQTRIEQAQGGLDGALFAMYPQSDSTFRQKFLDRFSVEPGNSADTAYDALKLLAQLIEASGDSIQSISHALHNVRDYKGASGTITLDPKGGVARQPVLYRVQGAAYQRLAP